MGSLLCKLYQSLALCAESSLTGAQGIPLCHISITFTLQAPSDLLGQDDGSIWITELMIKENTNWWETSAAVR